MSGDLLIQTNGPYLRVVLPDFEPDWVGVWEALDIELEEGINRAEIVAPCYLDEGCVSNVRDLVGWLEARGVETIVEWQGTPSPATAGAKAVLTREG
jgi:hypothetical protein